MAYVVVQRPRPPAPRRECPVHQSRQQALGIEAVSNPQPWHVRYRPWLVAGGVAAGFLAMRWLLERRLVENPRSAKDPETWMLPIDMGPAFDETKPVVPEFDAWLTDLPFVGVESRHRDNRYIAYIDLARAIGAPENRPLINSLGFKVLRRFALEAKQDILNITDLIERACTDKKALQDLWFVIYNPRLTYVDDETREFVLKHLRRVPKQERWRVSWLLRHALRLDPGQHWPDRQLQKDEIWRDWFNQALELPYKEFVRDHAPTASDAWNEIFERVPRSESLKMLVGGNIADFNSKAYLRAYRYLSPMEGMRESDAIRGATGLQFVFGNNWRPWVEGMEARGIDAHDATSWLPTVPSPGLDKFLRRHALVHSRGESGQRYPRLGKPLESIAIIGKRWNELEQEQRFLPFEEILSIATTGEYGNVESEKFAREAARWGIAESYYDGLESRWLDRNFSQILPDVTAVSGDLRAFLLPKDDPRGLFLGMHTACCQEPEGAGAACAWWGVEKPSSGFYVVEDASGKIVAQAWTWKHGDVVVFDNIEGPALQSVKTQRAIIDLYGNIAVGIVEADASIAEVRIGETVNRRIRGATIDWDYPEAREEGFAKLIPPPLDFLTETDSPYTDASERQFIMATSKTRKSTHFDSPGFRKKFADATRAVLASGDTESIEIVAEVITSLKIPHELDCQIIDDEFGDIVDSITSDYVFRCHLLIGGTSIDHWSTCVRVCWEDSCLDTVWAKDCDNMKGLDYRERGTDELMEGLDIEIPDANALASEHDIMPPLPPPELIDGKFAVGVHDYIHRFYDNEEDAFMVADMMNEADASYDMVFSVYSRLDNPEDDDEHDEGDNLYGWKECKLW